MIDAKTYKGRPQLKVEGGFLRPRVQMLLVGGCDCTKFVDGVLRQTETVRAMIGSDVPIHGVLCSVGADWPLVGGSFNVNGAASSGGERRSPSLSPARLSGLQPRRSRARRERRQRSRRTRGPARHPGSCAPPFAYSPTGSRMRRAMMTAATLDAMVTTCAKVASSNGHCWMRSTRFSKASAALRRPTCCWSTASVGSS